MNDEVNFSPGQTEKVSSPTPARRIRRRHPFLRVSVGLASGGLALACVSFWVQSRANVIKDELEAGMQLLPTIQKAALDNQPQLAAEKSRELQARTAEARRASEDPIWTLASAMPWLGPNLSATSEVARSADDVATLGVAPLVGVLENLDWSNLVPTSGGTDLGPIKEAAPRIASAAHAVSASAGRLEAIDTGDLVPQVAEPLVQARSQLRAASGALRAAGDAAGIASAMMGSEGPRNYLLLIQNNAEVRASGGIPTALAVLTLEDGSLKLGQQTTANELGRMEQPVLFDKAQETIYSTRVGKYMQDVNLTPDFPTAASTAVRIWQEKTGTSLDGVVSVDPVALGYILDTTGPVRIDGQEAPKFWPQMPAELSGQNVVKTLLSDVYSQIPDTSEQDIYFAAVANEVFSKIGSGASDRKALFDGIQKGVTAHRVLLWSANPAEQAVITKYPVGGSVDGESVAPAQFGVYFNDGTGAKMDYYVKRTVQLVKECSRNGYEQTTVRVTSTNTAPADAATSLPAYVTGGGAFGIPPGSVQTNIVTYGPVQSNVETATVDGQRTDFAPYIHSNRPVGILAISLAPGESRTVDFSFGKIVQHTEPKVVVTPTVQAVKDVILPTENSSCGQ